MQLRKLIFLGIFIIAGCQEERRPDSPFVGEDTINADRTRVPGAVIDSPEGRSMTVGGVSLIPLTSSPDFPNAILELNQPEMNSIVSSGKVNFKYEVKNYELTKQTPGVCHDICANSDQGQHIHLILNNAPYIAKYDTDFSHDLDAGHYVALSFLSRSYHESLKHREAYDLRQFTVGKATSKKIDLTQPMMFYSRPKGEYGGNDIANILLDFYIVNADLSPEGYKVRATINGNEFLITTWQPYLVRGLHPGEATFKLEFLDKDNKLVNVPFNPVERKITLKGAS
ncbi:MAG: hypothetical protein ACK40G_04810 [Cytophagaceae bacterium]